MSTIDLLRSNGDNSFFLPTPYTNEELIAASHRFAKKGDLDTAARFLSATGIVTFKDALVMLRDECDGDVVEVEVSRPKQRGVTKRYRTQQYGRYPLRRSVQMATDFLASLSLTGTRKLRNGKRVHVTAKKELSDGSGPFLAF